MAATGDGSALDPAGPAAREITTLWWVMFVVAMLVFGAVVVLFLAAFLRRRGESGRRPDGESSRVRWLVLGGGVIAPLALLSVLFVWMLQAIEDTSASAGSASGLTIDVIARQWFWDVSYRAQGIRDANELHIPVGRSVTVHVTSADVIHSLWVPALNRKIDAIPGRMNSIELKADRAGSFIGRCAEFCGLQHAQMRFVVVAQDESDFAAWRSRAAQPAAPPTDAHLREGQQVFLGSSCVYCHTIAGTNASGTIGPDLTHVASRQTIGAGSLPNAPGYLAGWIVDPQHVKPGNYMPGSDLQGDELQALLDYLESLR
jgi:cytochrome c oxidase subunit 2